MEGMAARLGVLLGIPGWLSVASLVLMKHLSAHFMS